jgi:hypothetical protein
MIFVSSILQVPAVRASPKPLYVLMKKSVDLCTPLAYHKFMEFIESHIFEKQVNALLSDDEFALFQGFLFSNPKAGAVIQQTADYGKFAGRCKERAKAAACG